MQGKPCAPFSEQTSIQSVVTHIFRLYGILIGEIHLSGAEFDYIAS